MIYCVGILLIMSTKGKTYAIQIFAVDCIVCGKTCTMSITREQADRINNRYENHEHIQDIIPEVEPEIREMLVSGLCSECWNKMFGGFTDDMADDLNEQRENKTE